MGLRASEKPKSTNKTPKKGGTRKAVTRARSDRWPARFIAELRKRGIVLDAAKATRVSRSTAYKLRDSSPEFKEQWNEALDEAADVMEGEAFRRAVKGVRRPVYQGGKRAGYVQEYSDTLLIFLLKGARPHKFREVRELSGPGGGPVVVKRIENMSDDDLDDRIEKLAQAAAGRAAVPVGREESPGDSPGDPTAKADA
jgi:hypothetical protein